MNNRVYVGNISWGLTNEELADTFSAFGTVTRANIVTDRETQRSKGFAFVSFETATEATAAIEAMDGQELGGRALRVSLAQEKQDRGGERTNDRRPRDNNY